MMTLNYHKVWESMNDLEMVTSKICSAREILDSAIDAHQEYKHEKVELLLCAVDEFLQYYLAEFDEKFKVAWKETVTKLKTENEDHYEAVLKEKEYYDTAYKGPAWDGDTSQMPWAEHQLANPLLTQDRDSNFPGENTICDKDDKSPECQKSWNDLWEEHYYPDEHSEHYYQYDRNDPNKENPFVDKVVKWQLPVEEVKDADTDEIDYCITFPDDLLEAANLKEGDDIEWIDRGDGSFLLKKVDKLFEVRV